MTMMPEIWLLLLAVQQLHSINNEKVNLAAQVIVCTFCVIVLIVSYYFLFCIKGYDWPVHWNLLAMTTPPRLGDSYG